MQQPNVPSDHDRRGHWAALAIVVLVLVVALVIGVVADWRAFVTLPPLLVALRSLVEAVDGHTT
jgi:hypothetical protein